MASRKDPNLRGKKPPMTYTIGDIPELREALDRAYGLIHSAEDNFGRAKNFFRVINGVLVSESEYQDWLSRGGHRGNG